MGGKAFTNTRRIAKGEIQETLGWLQQNWPAHAANGGKLMDHVLGSASCLEPDGTAGDLDLNLHEDRYDQAVVAQDLIALLGADNVKAKPGNNQIFTSIPIRGDEMFGRVQVDFMFGDYEWQKFSYFSVKINPDHSYYGQRDSSAFKGLYRTEFIKSLVAFNSDWVLEENGEMIARVGPTFFHDRGVVWRYRHRPMRKDGTARVKALEELTQEEFLKLYPSAITARHDVCKDPETVVKMLGDKHTALADFNSLERIVYVMRRLYTSEQISKVFQIYLERLNSLKVDIPTEKFRRIYLR